MSDVTPRPGTGGAAVITPGSAEENELLMRGADNETIIGSGAIYDNVNDIYVFPASIQTPATSVKIGENITLSENGGFLENETTTLQRRYLFLDYFNDPVNGTDLPIYYERLARQQDVVIQADDSQQMLNITTTTFGIPAFDRQNQAIAFNFINPVTNFAIEVVVNTRVVGHYPSLAAFNGDEPGFNLAAGVSKINLDPFFSNLTEYDVTFNYRADQNIDVLGNGTIPYYTLDLNRINRFNVTTDRETPVETISTGLISGGLLSQNTATTIDVAAGTGRIVSFNVDGSANINQVSWDALTNQPIPDIGTQPSTLIAIDGNGAYTTLSPLLSPERTRQFIILGTVDHATGTIDDVYNDSLKPQEVYSQYIDTLQTLGVTKKTGLVVTGNANLTINKTAGELEVPGGGNIGPTVGQNLVRINASSPQTFQRILGITGTIENSATTLIDPGFYDSGVVTKTALANATDATIQYVYQFGRRDNGVVVLYGQTVYSSLDEALLNSGNDEMNIPESLSANANLIGRIVITRDATDLTDEDQAVLLGGVKFGAGIDGFVTGSLGGGGDVNGPATSTTNEIPTFADATGKVLQSSTNTLINDGIISTRNTASNSEFRLETNVGVNRGGFQNDATNNLISAYKGTPASKTNQIQIRDADVRIQDKLLVNDLTQNGRGIIQANSKATDTDSFTADNNAPMVANLLTSNGGNTPAPPAPVLILERSGAPGQAFGNIARFDLSRYEVSGINSRTQLDVRLSHTGGGGEGNNQPSVFRFRSDGTARVTQNFQVNGNDMIIDTGGTTRGSLGYNATNNEVGLFNDGTSTTSTQRIVFDANDNIVMATTVGAFRPPQMTTVQRDALTGITAGMFIDNTDNQRFERYDGATWQPFTGVGNVTGPVTSVVGRIPTYDNTTGDLLSNQGQLVLSGSQIQRGTGVGPEFTNIDLSGLDVVMRAKNSVSNQQTTFRVNNATGTAYDGSNARLSASDSLSFILDGNGTERGRFSYRQGGGDVELIRGTNPATPDCVLRMRPTSASLITEDESVTVDRTTGVSLDTQQNIDLLANGANSVITLNPTASNVALTVNGSNNQTDLSNGTGIANFDNGRLRLRENSNNANFALANNANTVVGGLQNNAANGFTRIYRGDGVATPSCRIDMTDTQIRLENRTIVGGNGTVGQGVLQVQQKDATLASFTDDQTTPLVVNDTRNNGGNTPAAPTSAIIMTRAGVPNDAFANIGRFDLSRYVNDGANSRSQMDLRLSNLDINVEQNNTPVVASFRSNGHMALNGAYTGNDHILEVNGTSGAFLPPRLTTVQREALTVTEGAIVYDTDLDLLGVFSNGVWNTLNSDVVNSVVARIDLQNAIALSGTNQIINTGALTYFDVNNRPDTTTFTNGVWTCDIAGKYQVNIRGIALRGPSNFDIVEFYTAINADNPTTSPNNVIFTDAINGPAFALSGVVDLAVNDTLGVGYSVISGTGWTLNDFVWDFHRVSN